MTKTLLVIASVAAVVTGVTVMAEYNDKWLEVFFFIDMILLALSVFVYLIVSFSYWEDRKLCFIYYNRIRKDDVISPGVNFAFALFSFPQFIAIAVLVSLHYPKLAAPVVLAFSLITALVIHNTKLARRVYKS